MSTVAVIGGGMFGTTIALKLADFGVDVTLFEAKENVLQAASGSNQWRLHRGYHYPQSDQTAASCRASSPAFVREFGDAVITDRTHYYAIAKESWVPPEEYKNFCDQHDLTYEEIETKLVDDERVSTVLEVEENHVDPDKVRSLVREQLHAEGVSLELNHRVTDLAAISDYDYTVVATYAHTNSLFENRPELQRRLRFELCEIPVVNLPARYHGYNIIVVYGPFMSVDHWGQSSQFIMGDYNNMVHAENVGYKPTFPDEYADVINAGLLNNPPMSNFDAFRETGQQYIPGVADADYVGSMFTLRTKLPNVEDTDARPSVVKEDGDIISVLGGKLATSVETAEEVAGRIV
jgi:hypothetical protein